METDIRRDALPILESAVRAVDPEALVRDALESRRDQIESARIVHVVAFGKAAAAMARGAREALGDRVARGVVVAPEAVHRGAPPGFETFAGGHPLPTEGGLAGARAVRQAALELDRDDLLICLVSGGASSMMSLPPDGISIDDLREMTAKLLQAGADINELNAVRKRIDRLKAGRLARDATPARVLGLIISDVVGDPLDVVASGPLTPDRSTFDDTMAVLTRFGVEDELPAAIRDHIARGPQVQDAPGLDDPCFREVESVIVGNGRLAARAACAEARKRGYETLMVSTSLTGEAREVGEYLASVARTIQAVGDPVGPPACIVTAGETKVTVRGDGKGGRNQEVAMGAAYELDGLDRALVASLGTDGIDGPTEAAGAIATGSTMRRAASAGLDWRRAADRNDAYPFFEKLGDLIVTGPTGTNVADIQVVLVR